MFDAVSSTIERGEAFAQSCSPATLAIAGSPPIPCKIGQITFHEFLGPGGLRTVRSMRVTLRRCDLNQALNFTRDQQVTVKRSTRGANEEETIELKVGEDNGSDSVTIRLTLERTPV